MKTAEEILRDKFKNAFLDLEYIELHTEAMEEYAELKVKEALESKPVAVAWPSEEEINIKCKSLEFELGDVAARKIVDFIKQSVTTIDLEDFLKWYKPNHKLFYYDEPSNIIEKYNEYKQNKNE